jgi:hypothetical protein
MKKRLTLFAGHYGSGKTNIAVNYARKLSKEGFKTALADLDIVNPYFRTKDSEYLLKSEGIELVVSDFANSNVDFPALPKDVYSIIADKEKHIVMDIGGDDRGALALGRWAEEIVSSNDYEMLAVINASRPLTKTPEDTVEVLREIENACSIAFTGVVNNTNLGPQTTAADIIASMPYAEKTASLLGLEVRFTCCTNGLLNELEGKIPKIFPIEIQKLYYHIS